MQQLDAITSGSEYNFADKMERPNFPRSAFNLSHNVTMSFPVGSVGALVPIACWETLPTDTHQISVNHLLRVLPQVVPPYSKMKLYVHGFYCRTGDLWNVSNVYYTKGYSGNRVLKKPTLTEKLHPFFTPDNVNTVQDGDLFHYLYGLPIGVPYKSFYGKLSALPYMMYLKIWRDYFCNKYFYTDNRYLLPDDDTEFRLNSNGEIISDPNLNLSTQLSFSTHGGFLYRDYADDRFTSAMPSPQRGDAASIDATGLLHGYLGYLNSKGDISYSGHDLGPLIYEGFEGNTGADGAKFPFFKKEYYGDDTDWLDRDWYLQHRKLALTETAISYDPIAHVEDHPFVSSGNRTIYFQSAARLYLNDIRQLAINQTELEKMAKTDGSYREFGLTFFGQSSKIAVDYRPLFIGGTWQPIVFTEVVQTSASSNDSALGSYAGHGISSNSANLGTCQCDDYGWIMILASIVPDTLYSQGIDKQFTRLYQVEEILPERTKLGAQPILNKELYFDGTPQDDDLFAYQDMADEFRYMSSKVRGKLANPSNNSFFPYTQSRHFTQRPTYSQSFATLRDNVRMDFLTAHSEVPFTADFALNIRSVRPIPYNAIPARII